MSRRTRLLVRGIVQGVGFRPFVYSLANRDALKGQVMNSAAGVVIDIEGASDLVERFISDIRLNPPPLSQIESIERQDDLEPSDFDDFRIVESTSTSEKTAHVSADVATCMDCLAEMLNPADRRFHYPFINCTNCGPRFTIVENIPYDRRNTTMRDFPMCSLCRIEYENPRDRRFHAEPIACADCGPHLSLIDAANIPAVDEAVENHDEDVISWARGLLLEGKILAIKGLGGFQFTCNALDASAVTSLRQRKYREDKPFALMASTLDIIERYCHVSEKEISLLNSGQRPIVLLEKRETSDLPEVVAPGISSLGFMLPTAPLHYLLLEGFDFPLVMTSGNISDEPISYIDDEAFGRLRNIADYFLWHDRRIQVRTDDSVLRIVSGRETVLRRSRGYAPAPVLVNFAFQNSILACGAELKNTFCLARGNHAYISHYIGDLENLETLRSFDEGIRHFQRLFNISPELVAYDLHPEYLSTKYAFENYESLPKTGVQHHHAHIASCMADNGIDGDVIGVAFDGLGYGTDGQIWGGEFFVANFTDAKRVAHLDYIPMPGGTKSIREPWRMAASYLYRTFGDDFLTLKIPFVETMHNRPWNTLRSMIESGVNSPLTSSMGRLFDAVSALLCIRDTVRYEGQAAVELEMIAAKNCDQYYEFERKSGEKAIKAEGVIRAAVEDLLNGTPARIVSARFHTGVGKLIACVARDIRANEGLDRVVLSGGVFQNIFLLKKTCEILIGEGFQVFTHHRVPSNDGGISLGQAAVVNALVAAGRVKICV